jgi:hypothetical protein
VNSYLLCQLKADLKDIISECGAVLFIPAFQPTMTGSFFELTLSLIEL